MPIPSNLRRYIHMISNPPHTGGEAEVPDIVFKFQLNNIPNPTTNPHGKGKSGVTDVFHIK